jgi:uncharacterized membrane protein YcaP (DUF421 family)
MALFDGWASVARVIGLAAGAYVLLIAALRIAGPQALTKMSAFDLVITIALGSIVATIPLGSGVSLADGAAIIVTYLLLQAATRRFVNAGPRRRNLVKSSPRLIMWDGRLLEKEMRDVDVTPAEVHAAIRKAGQAGESNVMALVLENDGEWSVVTRSPSSDLSALDDLAPGGRATIGPARYGRPGTSC